MSTIRFWLLAIILSTLCTNSLAISVNSPASMTVIKDKFGEEIVSTINTEFKVDEYWNIEKFKLNEQKLILEETKEVEYHSEFTRSKITTTQWIGKSYSSLKKGWQLSTPANSSKIKSNMYLLTNSGCCTEEDVTSYYNIKTGKKVFSTSANHFSIGITADVDTNRFIGYWSTENVSIEPPKKSKNMVGLITFNSSEKNLEEIQVFFTGKFDFMQNAAPKIYAYYKGKERKDEHIEIYENDLKKLQPQDFILIIDFNGKKIEIPVKNDKLDLISAKKPDGFYFQNK